MVEKTDVVIIGAGPVGLFAVFELGTNNFGEIKKIVQLVLPSQVIITNIQSTHLANFKNKRKIAIEKSDIFNPKYNPNIRSLIFLNINKEENLLLNYAKYTKEKDDWQFEPNRVQRYKIKQGLISKCEWLPVFDGSEKLFMFLDKDAPKSEVEI